MAKFNTIKVLAAGGVNLFALNAKDEKLLVVNTATQSYVIPVIKNVAYIEDDDVETYVFLQNIIDGVNSNKVWRELFKLTPINKKAPEHSTEVVDFISAPGVNIAKNYLTVLKDNGYTMLEKVLSTSFAKRDYSALLKDPEIKKMFDEDAAELKKVGATFSGLDKEPEEIKIINKVVSNPEKKFVLVWIGKNKNPIKVQCDSEDTFDTYVGVAIALSKQSFGSTTQFRKAVDDVLIEQKPKVDYASLKKATDVEKTKAEQKETKEGENK